MSPCTSTTPRHIGLRRRIVPMPTVSERDLATARELRTAICQQNWKNGGAHVMDVDEAEKLIATALAQAREDALRETAADLLENLGRDPLIVLAADRIIALIPPTTETAGTIGRPPCRERECQYVEPTVVAA